jgi:hypothetical protein
MSKRPDELRDEPEVRDAYLLGLVAKYELKDGRSVALDPQRLILLYRPGTAPDIEPRAAQLEAGANAVRCELDNVEALNEYSEQGAEEICRDVARAVLEATTFRPV